MGSSVALGLLDGLTIGLSLADFAIPIALALWSMLLLFQMNKVNCSDRFTGAVYVAFLSAAGVTLALALPAEFTGESSFKQNIIWFMFFVMVSSLRWFSQFLGQERRKVKERREARSLKNTENNIKENKGN